MSPANQLWSSPASVLPNTSAAFGLGSVFWASLTGRIHSVDYQDGDPVWDSGEYIVAHLQSSPSYANGTVYFSDDEGYLYAVDAGDGSLLWQVQVTTVNPVYVSAPLVASTAGNGSTLYVCDNNNLYCVQ